MEQGKNWTSGNDGQHDEGQEMKQSRGPETKDGQADSSMEEKKSTMHLEK